VVVWDGGAMHKGDPIAQLQDVIADRLSVEKFSSYTPMFCPLELPRSWLEQSRLCNFASHDAGELDGRVVVNRSTFQDCLTARTARRRADQPWARWRHESVLLFSTRPGHQED
jgi:hypothetical protein